MRVSFPPLVSQLIFITVMVTGLASLTLAQQPAVLERSNGQRLSGEVVRVRDGAAVFRDQNGATFNIRLDDIARFRMAPPEEFEEAEELYDEGDFTLAAGKYLAVYQRYNGLPARWMAATLVRLATIHIQEEEWDDAKKISEDYKNYYSERADALAYDQLINAMILVGQEKLDEARAVLDELGEVAAEKPHFDEREGAFHAQLSIAQARIAEEEGNLSKALENYLKVVTIYYHDETLLTQAKRAADQLLANNEKLTVP